MSLLSTTNPESDKSLTQFKVRVLLVDDQLIIVEALRRMLSAQDDIEFHYVTEADQALQTAIELRPTVILQDLVMPGSDGFELLRQYRTHEYLEHVPVLVLSAREDPKLKAHAFASGANDYLVKLPDQLEMLARVRYHSDGYIHRLQRDQAFRFLRESQQQLTAANIELQKLAALDALTGISNRRRFDEAMLLEWQRGQRERQPLSLLMCDVDCFKVYNDTYGHQAGDLCLKRTAAVLTEHLRRPADLVARYGGEEFAFILPDTDGAGAMKVARACVQTMEQLSIENRDAPHRVVTLSIGVATMVPSKPFTQADLIGAADNALYAAKRNGRNGAVDAASVPSSAA
ncbi:diguanylate cyclase [Pseudoduganella sp. RAF19]|uniref:diguanylate cyclase n=1 Tax=Pseudoduganella sp. RAF19 TaxID=3233052 RepID=UPI003F9508A3